ncbi:DDE_3 domain-containing protein [Trichonephila clavipes]|nr:DDE_3 domain-containing protein [Trichonephila clavipes]
MDDIARPQRANIVDECLQSEDINRMDWPAYSPDLKPIEHVWDMLGRRISHRQPPPTYLPELRRALLDERCNIPQDHIDNLYSACVGVFLNESHHELQRVTRYQTDKLAGCVGGTETFRNHIGTLSRKCNSYELWCEEVEKKSRNSKTLMQCFSNCGARPQGARGPYEGARAYRK